MNLLAPGPLLQFPEWLEPAGFGLAVALALLAAGRLLGRRRGRRLLGPQRPRSAWSVDALPLLALLALATALLGPRLGQRTERVEAAGADVVVLVDVSASMRAQDVPPDRLARARRAARDVLGAMTRGDRAALAAYAGHGVLLTPLTHDTSALLEMLPFIDPDLVPAAGSRLDDGVLASLAAFGSGDDRPRVILVLSDGEDPASRSVTGIAAEAARAGVRVVTVGFGTTEGARIPDGDEWLLDRRGQEVRSRLDPDALFRLAEMTDGEAFRADEWGEVETPTVLASVRRDVSPVPGSSVERRVAAVWVTPFALLAFGLLALEALGRPHLSKGLAGLGALTLLVSLGASSPEERAVEGLLQQRPGDPELLLQLGIVRAERGRTPEARRAFTAAALRARDPELAAVAYHDLGVAALSEGDLEAARDAFLDAIALAPGNRRSIYNLEWTLAALAQDPPPPPPSRRPQDAGDEQDERERPQPESAPGSPDPLTPEEARRWLEQARDAARRGLRAAGVDAEDEGPPGARGPGW